MSQRGKLGLALSGGGFRASAFHLGVLKRLRELRVLHEVDVLSTVSGGSITGAFWVYWQALKGDTLEDEGEWDRFERALIELIRGGLRAQVIWLGFGLPFGVLTLLALGIMAFFGFSTPGQLLLAGVAVVACSLLALRYSSGEWMRWLYDRRLFHGARMEMIRTARKAGGGRKIPELFINATCVESGRQVLITEKVRRADAVASVFGEASRFLGPFGGVLRALLEQDKSRHTPHQLVASLAKGVAASTAVPGVFPPVSLESPGAWFRRTTRERFPNWFPHKDKQTRLQQAEGRGLTAVDGGIYDNQGTLALFRPGECERIILSDAAAILEAKVHTPTSQLGILRRSQDIIFSRVQDEGYRQLQLRHDLYRLVDRVVRRRIDSKTANDWRGKVGPLLEGYCQVQLEPPQGFKYQKSVSCLPKQNHPSVARIRTDLDGFSWIEISALMYHGYTLIDHSLYGSQRNWIRKMVPSAFRSSVEKVNIDWADRDKNVTRLIHLLASGSRSFLLRTARRWKWSAHHWISEQNWAPPRFVAKVRRKWDRLRGRVPKGTFQLNLRLREELPEEKSIEKLIRIIKRSVEFTRGDSPEGPAFFWGNSTFAHGELMIWCESHGVEYVIDFPLNEELERMIVNEAVVSAEGVRNSEQTKRIYRDISYRDQRWGRTRRVVVRADPPAEGASIRGAITSLSRRQMTAAEICEDERFMEIAPT